MTEVYPGYADEVAFYAVGEDPTEDLERLERFRIGQGHPWPVAESDPSIIRSFRVLERSTKIAVHNLPRRVWPRQRRQVA